MFTSKIFKGNPAAVMMFKTFPTDDLMLNIAKEFNLSETAFVVHLHNNKKITTINLVKTLEKLAGIKGKIKKIGYQSGEVLDTHADVKKTYDFFKFKSVTPIEDGIKKFLKWYMKYNKIKNEKTNK